MWKTHHGGTETRRKDAAERSDQREIGDQAHRHLSGVLSSIVPMIRCPDVPMIRSPDLPRCLRVSPWWVNAVSNSDAHRTIRSQSRFGKRQIVRTKRSVSPTPWPAPARSGGFVLVQ